MDLQELMSLGIHPVRDEQSCTKKVSKVNKPTLPK